MSKTNVEQLILRMEGYLECWKQFNTFMTMARTKKFSPEDRLAAKEAVLLRIMEIPVRRRQTRTCRVRRESLMGFKCQIWSSVPIPKFLCSFSVIADCSATEALDRCEDVVGRFGPSERFWIGVASLDISVDRGFQLCSRSMHPTFDLLL